MNKFNIKQIIESENIVTHFQPIVNLKEKRVVGIEALSRGINPDNGSLISPIELFDAAKEAEVLRDLDRLCRRLAIKNYKNIKNHDELVLFVNLNTSVLNIKDDPQVFTKIYAEELGVNFTNIVIEIVESELANNKKLVEIIERYREIGFFVALDDFGALHSNLNRLVITKPDIIKIDRSLISNVSTSYYQRSIIKAIISLAKTIGSLTLAEGLENDEDIFTCYSLGIDLYQGFYFCKPSVYDEKTEKECSKKITACADKIKQNIAHTITENKRKHLDNIRIIKKIKQKLRTAHPLELFNKFQEIANDYFSVQCIYLLDQNGTQVGATICGNNKKRLKRNQFFRPAEENDDHSLKDYFYFISHLGLDRYYTNPYISLASGQLCRTASFKTKAGIHWLIVCIDFIEETITDNE